MEVVHERVSDVRTSQDRRHLRFPDALGQPRAGRARSEMLRYVVGEPNDLLMLIFRRNDGENRLIKTAADKFDLFGSDERPQQLEVLRMVDLNPLEKWAGIMQ